MIYFYRILFLPLFLIAIPYYLKRMFKRGGYAEDFSHRFGLHPSLKKKEGIKRIWIQAVSVGEINAIGPLLDELNKLSNTEIVLTTTTSTAYAIANKKYADKVIHLGIFPLDFWPFSALTWKRLKPDLAILMEGDLWPEHIHQANKRSTPIALINARMSDRSFSRYQYVSWIAKRLLTELSAIVASNPSDYERLLKLGSNPKTTTSSGNLKLEVHPELLSQDIKNKLIHEIGFSPNPSKAKPLILLGSSIWPGEELILLSILEQAIQEDIELRLIIVPRHPENKNKFLESFKKQTRAYHFRSDGKKAPYPSLIYCADTIGELSVFTQIADLAFIGKSTGSYIGGQSPIEAAALGVPAVMGPNMSNFKQVVRHLVEGGAAIQASSIEEIPPLIIDLLQDETKRSAMSLSCKEWHIKNQGALKDTLAIIKQFIESI